jgi:hypothetical protein
LTTLLPRIFVDPTRATDEDRAILSPRTPGASISTPRHFWIPRAFWLLVSGAVLCLVATLAWTATYTRQRMAAIEYVRSTQAAIRFHPLPTWWPAWIPVPEWIQSVHFIDADHSDVFTLSRIAPLHELSGLAIASDLGPEGLSQVSRFRHLKRIHFHNRKVNDADLAYLSQCRELESLDMWEPAITDDGLRSLQGLRLIDLAIKRSSIGDEGVQHLAGMPLRELNLHGAAVGDEGVRYLEGMPLRELDLEHTQVSDAGLETIAKLPLEDLNLTYTRVTLSGLRTLLGTKTLQRVRVEESAKFNDQDIEELQRAGLPVEWRDWP